MKNGKIFAVTFLTAAAILLPGCEPVTPADETRLERSPATIEPTTNPDAEMDELWRELIDLPAEEPEESITPVQLLSAQETPLPEIVREPVTVQITRPSEMKSAAETAQTETPKSTAMPRPTTTPKGTVLPTPTATPRPTPIPVITSTPMPTATPRSASTPKPTATPSSVSTPEPTPSPTPTPVPTATLHIHSWTMHGATGHHETQKAGIEEVTVGTYWEEIGGWDEDCAGYYRCNDCGAEFSSNLDAGDHILSAYHSSYSYYPAETVHHDGEWVERTQYEMRDVYEDVWVVDSGAYWTCACGETKQR